MNESNAQFRSVLRGYDTAQVDQHVSDLTQAAAAARREAGDLSIQVSKLEAAQRQLAEELKAQGNKARALEEEQKKAAAPTYADLGQRIGSILKLADEEGNELRTKAKADAEAHHALADESARATREGADVYAKETRSAADAEVARLLEDARRRADSIMDDADRQATARREEAEAVYERARAKSAAAAADFETTLATRRDTSAQEFAAQVTAAEQQLAAIQQRAEQTRAESERSQQEAANKSAHQLSEAQSQAKAMVAEAKAKSERIRDDSERVLVAATQRRDSINAQLTNVRQMLATLSGGAMVNAGQFAETVVADASAPVLADPLDPKSGDPKSDGPQSAEREGALSEAVARAGVQEGASDAKDEHLDKSSDKGSDKSSDKNLDKDPAKVPSNDQRKVDATAKEGNDKPEDTQGAGARKAAGVKG